MEYTAVQARQHVDDYIEAVIAEELKETLKLIKGAALGGSFGGTVHDKLSGAAIKKLIENGYNVLSNNVAVNIYW